MPDRRKLEKATEDIIKELKAKRQENKIAEKEKDVPMKSQEKRKEYDGPSL